MDVNLRRHRRVSLMADWWSVIRPTVFRPRGYGFFGHWNDGPRLHRSHAEVARLPGCRRQNGEHLSEALDVAERLGYTSPQWSPFDHRRGGPMPMVRTHRYGQGPGFLCTSQPVH